MNPNIPDNFAALAGLGIVFVVIYLVVSALLILLAIWIQYSIIWRAVRRGMREFHYGGKDAPQAIPPVQ
ncbi:hypothetical protein BKA04_001955 [Cryobacterium mesophilum]|uniref:Uncharacterized protein n=1 Tax=Terrimesophilobacter mesophilus TaxID=433647 RepID=A0A4R8VCI9_9MICO|nr:hypothetical protein [Terrimesophilobacter mesophilus]MBB5633732.1 hypothetical protein [Terrimesophilobacter mesophilus]TFB80415.1 hypothetical protein E3N84_10470 [Terrimesophilobacter mesophilus]